MPVQWPQGTLHQIFCLLAQASGAIDALFSRGMANTTMAINVVADTLLRAMADDDFSAERFEHVERLQQHTVMYYEVPGDA
jgi:FADH2 O2-dependent halogenase